MRYYTRRPTSPLSACVADLWLYSGYRPAHTFERILPTGTVEIVINLRNADPLRCYDSDTFALAGTIQGPLVSGARARHCMVDTAQQEEIMGVHFAPGGACALLGISVDEIHDQDVSLESLWGRSARELHERLLEETAPGPRLAILEAALLERMQQNRLPHPVVHAALRELEKIDVPVGVAQIAARFGWSDRHFIRTFTSQVGITPKSYGRIRRFQAALARVQSGRAPDWATLAVDCGYYDQAHLIRDFRAFSGITPTAYARITPNGLRHVPVEERAQVCPVVGADGVAAR